MLKALLEGVAYLIIVVMILSLPVTLKGVLNTDVPLAVVKSTSMVPTLNIGDIVVISGVNPKELKPGDVIIYDKRINVRDLSKAPYHKVESIGYIIIHRVERVYSINGEVYLVTKGDNNLYSDPWIVPGEGVLGRVLTLKFNGRDYILKIPYIGYLSLYLHGG